MENNMTFNSTVFGIALVIPFMIIGGLLFRKFIVATLTRAETVVMIISEILVAVGLVDAFSKLAGVFGRKAPVKDDGRRVYNVPTPQSKPRKKSGGVITTINLGLRIWF